LSTARRPTLTDRLRELVRVEATGGLVLVAATVLAIAWASSPWDAAYRGLWSSEWHLTVAGQSAAVDLRHAIDDGAMALFFFVIGLEIKQEIVTGRLADRRAAMAPVAGAIGGMVLPALIYAAVNLGGGELRGWAVPMATDVAFALAVMTLLGDRVPSELKVLLLGLAIVDDIGAVAVIAVFYSAGVALGWLAVAAAGLGAIALLLRAGVRWLPLHLALGFAVWAATAASGVHATIAGVALGLIAPARAQPGASTSTTGAARLQHALHPWTAVAVVPLFALANAGTPLSVSAVHDALTSSVGLGVALGLVVGKALGVTSAIVLAARLGIATVPAGIGRRHLAGLGVVAGIGFTVSLFVTQLAFEHPGDTQRATTAILVASAAAAALGAAILRSAQQPRR
jgi:NhaA family Na+:H+ antiporter